MGSGLAGLGSGISETYFAGWAQQQRDEKEKKDEELARQLAAYHALLEHSDTPESEIPNILDAQAKLLKAPKEFYDITAHMRQVMQRQVPYGPEKETTQSITDRMAARGSGIPESTMELPGSVPMRPTIPVKSDGEPGTGFDYGGASPDIQRSIDLARADDIVRQQHRGTMDYRPGIDDVTVLPSGRIIPNRATPLSGEAFTVTTPALLPRVPEEPRMYQPTKTYGDLSQGEATDVRKGKLYADQQEEMLRRQLGVQAKVAEAAAERERIRAEGAQKLEEDRQKGRIAVVQKTYEEKGKLLGPAAMAKIEAPRIAYENSLVATGMSAADAKAASYRLFQAQMDVDLANKKQRIEESKARMTRMGVQNQESFERIRKSKAGLAGAFGVSASQKREFDLRTGTLQNDLAHTLQLLDDAYKKAATVPRVGTVWENSPEKAEVERLEAKKVELWGQIDEVRNGLLNQGTPSVPSARTIRP